MMWNARSIVLHSEIFDPPQIINFVANINRSRARVKAIPYIFSYSPVRFDSLEPIFNPFCLDFNFGHYPRLTISLT